jgi:hypothetical protein
MADDVFDKAIAEQLRRELGEAMEKARRGEPGTFWELRGDLVEKDGVPDHVREYEIGAAFVDSAQDHAQDN